MLVSETVSSPGNPNVVNENQYVGTKQCAAGYMVTGGGFTSKNLNIIESRPEGNGWYVLGTKIDPNLDNTILTIHAVCAKVQ